MNLKVTALLAMLLCAVATARAQVPAEQTSDGEYFDVDVNDTPARAFFLGLVSGEAFVRLTEEAKCRWHASNARNPMDA